ncbi:GNAT family N-acetyltransferase [Saccharopolyspora gloriosae]|uniref:GNAT family N-acetyltransferase n=1 Tax=Saccharopolyspora gloriosae TaxID=455344 RepID=UPI001FB58254|nr:GNAT family N-acetyltransferase [Saccharopolyspora gloriosae]
MPEPAIEYVPAERAGTLQGELGGAYRDAFSEAPYHYGDEFVDLFLKRFAVQHRRAGASLVTARADGGELAGFGFGFTMPANTPWWDDLLVDVDPSITEEPAGRTFVLTELLVRRPWRGRRVATGLHDQILRDRPEQRATLTARPTATAAQHAYAKWGWRKVAQRHNPQPGSPLVDILLKDLRP